MIALQGMVSAADRQLSSAWRGVAARNVFPDFEELTLRVSMDTLFGAQLDPAQEREFSGEQQASPYSRRGQVMGAPQML